MLSSFPSGHSSTKKRKEKVNGLALHLIFHHLIVVWMSFGGLMEGTAPKICMLCFVLVNSLILNLLCVWILF